MPLSTVKFVNKSRNPGKKTIANICGDTVHDREVGNAARYKLTESFVLSSKLCSDSVEQIFM